MTKKALLVGLNEYGAGISWLRGCVNDVTQVKGLLQTYYGFDEANIETLINAQATRAGILDGIGRLTANSQAGDVLVFHYSGHGSQAVDNGHDELDGADEIIIPYDHDWNNPLRDDDLKAAFDRIGPGASLTVLLDCCHAGTGNRPAPPADADLTTWPLTRYLIPPDEVTQEIERLEQARSAEIETRARDLSKDIIAMLNQLGVNLSDFVAGLLGRKRKNRFNMVNTTENNVLLAACRDTQTSADAFIANDYHGAFTWCLAQAIQNANGQITHRQLVERIGAGGRAYDQIPQLECQPAVMDRPLFATSA